MNKRLNKKGFTIIEVVLVLAIAGLIFLMVFVALPRLQISQRDTQRRDDVAALATAVTQYQSNNGGRLPVSGAEDEFIERYLEAGGSTFNDPSSGETYPLSIQDYSGDSITDYLDGDSYGEMVIIRSGACSDEEGADGGIVEGTGVRSYAVAVSLEGSGYYCSDN